MQKKHIAIMFPMTTGGGVFQYALSLAESLVSFSDAFTYSIIHYSYEDPAPFFNEPLQKNRFIPIAPPPVSPVKKFLHFGKLLLSPKNSLMKGRSNAILENAHIDLLIVPTPLTYELPLSLPYIASVPDFMYKYLPIFHTVRDRMTRNIIYTFYARHARLLVADSKQGLEDLCKFTGIKRAKIRVIPYIPSGSIYKHKDISVRKADEILQRYNLPSNFLFYPAQFWSQKNHSGLVKALYRIKQTYGIEIPLVLVGHAKGYYERTYNAVLALVKELRMTGQVIHLGYVSELEIVALYKKALALVYPSLASAPTAIPPLEAMLLGTPVLISNLFELPEQVGEAGILFNPSDISDMAEKIYMLRNNPHLQKQLSQKGYEKVKHLTMERYAKQWEGVISEALGSKT